MLKDKFDDFCLYFSAHLIYCSFNISLAFVAVYILLSSEIWSVAKSKTACAEMAAVVCFCG